MTNVTLEMFAEGKAIAEKALKGKLVYPTSNSSEFELLLLLTTRLHIRRRNASECINAQAARSSSLHYFVRSLGSKP